MRELILYLLFALTSVAAIIAILATAGAHREVRKLERRFGKTTVDNPLLADARSARLEYKVVATILIIIATILSLYF